MGNRSREKTELLTEAQRDVLRFIKEACEKTGVAPSYREIQHHFGYKAVGTVQDHVRALVKKGALEEPRAAGAKRAARGLVPTGHRPEGTRRIPIYGEIAAGPTRDTPQIELGQVVIAEAAAKDPSFALRVVGDSMIEVGILEGDFLIVERDARVKDGDIVVALVEGETTVKRYRVRPDGVYLVPENRRLSPRKVEGDASIQGKVVGLQRKL